MHRIAIPISEGILSEQLEQCSLFAVYNVSKQKLSCTYMELPGNIKTEEIAHWMAESGISDIILYKAEKQSIDNFIKNKINLFIGIKPNNPIEIINDFIDGHLYSDAKIIKDITG